MINLKIANAMSGYVETLYVMNQNLIKICGADCLFYKCDYEKLILDIIQDIPRIIPYSYNNKIKKLCLSNRNGLLEYQNEIIYLRNDYESILINNMTFLDKVRKIRNKYEHKMHGVDYKSSGSGSHCLFEIVFEVKIDNKKEHIEIYAGELISLIKEINNLFSKIVKEIEQFAYANGKQDYSYYERLTRFDFKDFNQIFESTLLRKIGKVMNNY